MKSHAENLCKRFSVRSQPQRWEWEKKLFNFSFGFLMLSIWHFHIFLPLFFKAKARTQEKWYNISCSVYLHIFQSEFRVALRVLRRSRKNGNSFHFIRTEGEEFYSLYVMNVLHSFLKETMVVIPVLWQNSKHISA